MINPVAFAVGPVQIRWYGIIIAAAFAAGIFLAYRRAARIKMDPDHIINIAMFIIPAAIIGARLYDVAFRWTEYVNDPMDVLAVWQGGLSIHGGIIGGILAGWWYTKRYGLPVWLTADILAPSLILGQAIGRWGNFFNQEAHGGPVSREFISAFPLFIQRQMYIDGQYYHPAFLYESIWDLIVYCFLIFYWSRRKVTGEIALLYLALYSVGRFLIEFLRTDSLMLGPFKVAQLVSLFLIIAGFSVFYFRRKRTYK